MTIRKCSPKRWKGAKAKHTDVEQNQKLFIHQTIRRKWSRFQKMFRFL